jgi:paraquat-inducible protein A
MSIAASGPSSAAPPHRTRVLCPDCDQVQRLPPLPRRAIAECRRCGAELAKGGAPPVHALLALTVSALILYVPASFLPVLTVDFAGDRRSDLVATGAQALIAQGQSFWPVAVLVFLFTVLAPLAWLGSFATVLFYLSSEPRGDRHPAWLGRLLRFAERMRPWAMPEVFLIGGFVAYTRLGDLVTTDIGTGGWCFLAYAGCVLVINAFVDRRQLWEAILPSPEIGPEDAVFACHVCHLPLQHGAGPGRCPRCGARAEPRKRASFQRCAALVAAAYVLYVPANLLPIMTLVELGAPDRNTILSGILELIQYGYLPLAVVVFVASIAVPLIKLFGLTWCLASVTHGRPGRRVLRTRLYRLIEVIGRWSNIDVFTMSILVALVDYGAFSHVTPEPGAIAFAAVVFLTMLASQSFDPRLMWDAEEDPA